MKIQRAHVVRLYPDLAQEDFLCQIGGATRFLWNLALEQRQTWGQRHGLNRFSQSKELTQLRSDVDWLKACPSQVLQQVLNDLEKAFRNFFSRRAGFPKFRKKSRGASFRFPDGKSALYERLTGKGGHLKLPKIGWVRFRGWREIPGQIRNVTVRCDAGQWFAAIQYEHDVPEPARKTLPAVGIDRGVAATIAVSGQGRVKGPDAYRKAMKRLARMQHIVARRKKGSQNRRKAVLRVARLHRKVRRIRADFLHKVSHWLAKNHGTLVFEDLKIRNMVRSASGTVAEPGRNVRQKAGLNRSILDQGWGLLRLFSGYKTAACGGQCLDVPAPNTSRECRMCGHISAENRASQARFSCVRCGHAENADDNASVVIVKRAVDNGLLPVEAMRQHAREAGISVGSLLASCQ
ncbi:RNA-guided endonuclease InsQ/TnpB family protein [Acetobacter pasteurianus]|uniref:RNA-guided endonuclease InsQ/TnpB family protein n=1 Tax=Acetobacter pasteurianus TaxID=438 RepID=UPI001362643C|nr:RNA-guided endonuclease TnpB family protein [Acetobacter pasteurianus]QHM90391.1 transposase [Acetobacter pasteurianus]